MSIISEPSSFTSKNRWKVGFYPNRATLRPLKVKGTELICIIYYKKTMSIFTSFSEKSYYILVPFSSLLYDMIILITISTSLSVSLHFCFQL